MKLTIINGNENYACSVIRLPIKQICTGLDNLVRVNVFGNDCLIGKDSPENELYLFFPAESCIANMFCRMNNLYRNVLLNQDGKSKGFFEESGRVKALKFKGIISTGFVIPLSSLSYIDGLRIKDFKVGDEFTNIDNIEICKKYKIERQQSEKQSKESRFNKKLKRFDKLVPNQFRFHESTAHLAKNLYIFKESDIIVITDKWHGTSAVFSNVLVNKELNWKERVLKKIGIKIQDKVYDNLYSSRSVLKNQYINKEQNGGFYNEDIWGTVNKELDGKIEQGITIYGEIVGYLDSGKMIQKGYDYGCHLPFKETREDGTCNCSQIDKCPNGRSGSMARCTVTEYPVHKFLAYRITYTKPDGSYIEYSWQQIKDYCNKYGIEHVKELFFGQCGFDGQDEFAREEFINLLVEQHLEKKCQYCKNDAWSEGIVMRLDGKRSYSAFKLKSRNFLMHETKEMDTGEVNIEDEQLEEVDSQKQS